MDVCAWKIISNITAQGIGHDSPLSQTELDELQSKISELICHQFSPELSLKRETKFIQWQRVLNKLSTAYSSALASHSKAIAKQNNRDFMRNRAYTYALCSSFLFAGLGPASVVMNAIFLPNFIGPESHVKFQGSPLFQRGIGDFVAYPARKVLIEPKINHLIQSNFERTVLKPSDTEETVRDKLQDGFLLFKEVFQEKFNSILQDAKAIAKLADDAHDETGLKGHDLILEVQNRLKLRFESLEKDLELPSYWLDLIRDHQKQKELKKDIEVKIWAIWIVENRIGKFSHVFSEAKNCVTAYLGRKFSKLRPIQRNKPGRSILIHLHRLSKGVVNYPSRVPQALQSWYAWWKMWDKFEDHNVTAVSDGIKVSPWHMSNRQAQELREKSLEILRAESEWDSHPLTSSIGEGYGLCDYETFKSYQSHKNEVFDAQAIRC